MKEFDELLKDYNDVATANNWQEKHTPKNLAMAIGVEAAELAEIFQWLSEKEANALSEFQRQQASNEIADIFLYLLCLSEKLDINLLEAAKSKMEKNKRRFLNH